MWVVFLGLAQPRSADRGSVVFLCGLVAAQAALTVGCAALIRLRRGRLGPGLLPAVVWVLVVLDATLLCGSGVH